MSDSEDENYVSFGVPLDPLDEENLPRKKPITIADQCAYDSEGRRRFHGAFTGGFSAGYFNGVGSREGWQPRQFKSSRNEKTQSVLQRPEDFMDEEDISQFGIAPRGIRATEDYSEKGRGTKRERIDQNSGQPIPGVPVLRELVRPTRETIGIILLRRMGWKPGQGIGCRISQRQKAKIRQRNRKTKVYSCAPEGTTQWPQYLAENNSEYSEEDDKDDDDIVDGNITFAPDDYEPFRCEPKDNYFGIGYSGLNGQPVLSSRTSLFDSPTFNICDKNKRLSIRGQAFGVGAFEADDGDIYERDDLTRYDFALEPEHADKSRRSDANRNLRKCSDNIYLENFVEAKKRLERRSIPIPELPRDFVAIHKIRKSRFYPAIECDASRNKKGDGTVSSARDRARIIHYENEIISGGSVSRERNVPVNQTLNVASEALQSHQQKREDITEPPALEPVSWMKKLEEQRFVKGGIVGSVKEESAEQEFEPASFSTSSTQKNKKTDDTRLENTEEDRHTDPAERDAKEATKLKLFGKLTRTKSIWRPTSIVYKRFNIPECKIEIEQIGPTSKKPISIFDSIERQGSLTFSKETCSNIENKTEETTESSEARLFASQSPKENNVNAFSDERPTKKEKEFELSYEKVFGKGIQEKRNDERVDAHADLSQLVSSESKKENRVIAGTVMDADSECAYSKEKSQEKKDLFKSIFLSSSDSETEEDEAEANAEANVNETAIKSILIGEKPDEKERRRNVSPGRGIFAKLDFDEPISCKVDDNDEMKSKRKEEANLSGEGVSDSTTTTTVVSEVYGPALPARLLGTDELDRKQSISFEMTTAPQRTIEKSTVIANGKWVEACNSKKMKKQKKKKHKEHKSAKHKRKSKKRARSTSR